MNKWNRLVLALDEVHGFENKKKSTVRKVSQAFDEKTNEHVFMLEYRFQVGYGKQPMRRPVQRKPVEKKPVEKKQVKKQRPESENYPLLQNINDRLTLPSAEEPAAGGNPQMELP
jgi:hypothetical protein